MVPSTARHIRNCTRRRRGQHQAGGTVPRGSGRAGASFRCRSTGSVRSAYRKVATSKQRWSTISNRTGEIRRSSGIEATGAAFVRAVMTKRPVGKTAIQPTITDSMRDESQSAAPGAGYESLKGQPSQTAAPSRVHFREIHRARLSEN